MSRSSKIWLITATALMLIGAIIFSGVMTMLNWDFKKLSTIKYETNEHEITDDYDSISISGSTVDIKILPSNNSSTKVICFEPEDDNYDVSVSGGTLSINANEIKWYKHIGIDFNTPTVTVYVPKDKCPSLSIKLSTGKTDVSRELRFNSVSITASTGDVTLGASVDNSVTVKTSTGDILLSNMSASSINLSASTGRISLSSVNCSGNITTKVSTGKTNIANVKCANLISNGSTGDLNMTNVIASSSFNIKRSTGDVEFSACDAAEIKITTDTGRVKGSLLTSKVFYVRSDTGKTEYPHSTTGGLCEITTDTGNIKITVLN